MFYRMRFDGYVGGILKSHGYSTTGQLQFWPAGATGEWVRFGKKENFKPFEAAAIAVAEIAARRLEKHEIDQEAADSLVANAIFLAEKMGAVPKAIECLKRHLRPEPDFIEHCLWLDRGYVKVERSREELQKFPGLLEKADSEGNIFIMEVKRSGKRIAFITNRDTFEKAMHEHQRLDQSRSTIEGKREEIEKELKAMDKRT
jgi:hypothetical protein